MRPDQIKKTAEEFGISIKSAIEMRLRYLVNLAGQWDDYIYEKTNDIPELNLPKIFKEIDVLRRFDQRLSRGETLKQDVTDEMIEAAKAVPMDTLFDFSRGRTKCPFHGSKDNDLSWHKASNTVRCFGACGKSWDTIAVIMETQSMDFLAAVKYLAG